MTPDPPTAGPEGLAEVPRPAYDVCNPDRLPADRMAFVEGIHQQFLQAFGQALTGLLDAPVKATPAGIEQWPVAGFLKESATDACAVTLDLSPTRGQAWVGLSTRLVFRVLDILLGAPQTTAPSVRTTITEIEQHVLHEFFEVLIAALNNAWTPSGISLRKASIGTAGEARQTAQPDGTALVLNGKVKIAEDEETFRVAVPVLAVRLAALQKRNRIPPARWPAKLPPGLPSWKWSAAPPCNWKPSWVVLRYAWGIWRPCNRGRSWCSLSPLARNWTVWSTGRQNSAGNGSLTATGTACRWTPWWIQPRPANINPCKRKSWQGASADPRTDPIADPSSARRIDRDGTHLAGNRLQQFQLFAVRVGACASTNECAAVQFLPQSGQIAANPSP